MDDEIFFSILIPVYNAEKYINNCFKSIFNQEYSNFEVILVNDGSVDRSGEICEKYKNKYPNIIKLINQENKGQLVTRRIAMNEAKGDYFIFVDSDDWIKKDTLKYLNNIINEYDADLVIYNYFKIDYKGNKEPSKLTFKDRFVYEGNDKKLLYDKVIDGEGINPLWNKAIKRRLINFTTNYEGLDYVRNGEDLLEVLPIITRAKRILYLDKELYFYRDNPNGITNSFTMAHYNSVKYVNLELEKYLNLWNYDNHENLKRLYIKRLEIINNALISISNKIGTDKDRINNYKKIYNDNFFKESYKNTKNRSILLFLLNKNRFMLLDFVLEFRKILKKIYHILKEAYEVVQ